MGVQFNDKQLLRFEYDFAKDGGAVGVIPLRADITELAAGMHVLNVYVVQEADLVAVGGSVTLGNTTDPDGFLADFVALAASKKAFMAGEVAGALLWDDTNDHHVVYSPAVADDLDLALTVATAPITAGKLSVYVEVLASK